MNNAAKSLTGFDVNALATGGAVALLAGGIKSSIDTTIQWADSMDKLARNTGTTTEEASKMAVVMGDFGISAGTMEMALKSLNAKGLTLNIETLGKLAAEYQALPPGVERLKFATDKFGRSAQEMTEILSQTPAKLAAMGAAAEKSGKIMSGAAVDAAQDFKIELQQLNDEIDGLKIAAGPSLIKVVSAAVHGFEDAATAARQLDMMLRINAVDNLKWVGGIDETTAALRKQIIVNDGVTNSVKLQGDTRREAIAETGDMSLAQIQAAKSASYWTGEMWKAVDGTNAVAGAAQEAASKADYLADRVRAAADAHDALLKSQKLWMEGEAGGVASALQAEGLSADLTLKGLEALDKLYGTSLAGQAKHEAAIKGIMDEYSRTGDVDAMYMALDALNKGPASEVAAKLEEADAKVIALNADMAKTVPMDTSESQEHLEQLRAAAQRVRDAVDGIPRNVTITTSMPGSFVPGGNPWGSGGGSGGGPAPSPSPAPHPGGGPGGGPNRASGNGVTVIQNIYNPPPASNAIIMQTARAAAGGW